MSVLLVLSQKNLPFEEAAALPLATITAWESLFERLNVLSEPQSNRGTTILIIGGAGGVGSMAIQLAKYAGLRVVATARVSQDSRQISALAN